MSRMGIALVAGVLALAGADSAAATTYRGTAVDDPELTVRLHLGTDGTVAFEYARVPVECSNGDSLRQPGAEHLATIGSLGRFRDAISEEVDGGTATSSVRGRVGDRKARGSLSFDLVYEGGECHSGTLRWKAKRK